MSRRRRKASPGRRLALFGLVVLVAAGLWLSRTHREYLSLAHWVRNRSGRAGTGSGSGRLPQARPDAGNTITASIYFLRVTDREVSLVVVPRAVSAASPARTALEELISGPLPAGCRRPLPEGTKLRAVRVDGGIATADFTSALVTRFSGGSSNEGALVYSIVNTLTSLPGVEKARILVEGEQVESIGGHLDVRGPLTYDGELVRE